VCTACGIMQQRCCQEAASAVNVIINKTIIVAPSWLFILLNLEFCEVTK